MPVPQCEPGTSSSTGGALLRPIFRKTAGKRASAESSRLTANATQVPLLARQSTRFYARKTPVTWEPPYGIEP